MADEEQLRIFKLGVGAWNEWMQQKPDAEPDLSGIDLHKSNLAGINLIGTDLTDTDLRYANLTNANLFDADLIGTNLTGAVLNGAEFNQVKFGWTILADTDLSQVEGLSNTWHAGPSTIGVDTIYKSRGKISDCFLRDCGVPEHFITFIPSLIDAEAAIQYHSCFISYSHEDEEFAKRLHSRCRDARIRVWFAPEDMKGGEKLHEQIERAIQVHEKLLLVLSENSMQSEWVMTEIRNARKIEAEENRRKLSPIRLVDFDTIRQWKCFDAESAKDMAIEVREYFIPDFTDWKDHDTFESAFNCLLRDLRTEMCRHGRN